MKLIKLIVISFMLPFVGCSSANAQNSLSKKEKIKPANIKYAYFSSGCFWGTEYWFEKLDGVYEVKSGYTGGHRANPTYREVSSGLTGHLEGVEVSYDPKKISYEDLVKLFFETHDYTQTDGQGPDIGSQYLSAIFYQNEEEKNIAKKYIDILNNMNNKKKVATTLREFSKFYYAEDYHQDYYEKKGSIPYCHIYKKIF